MHSSVCGLPIQERLRASQPSVITGPVSGTGPASTASATRMDQTPESPELPLVRQEEDMWILRVETNGKVQEYRCGSEVQARALAILLLPNAGDPTPDAGPTFS